MKIPKDYLRKDWRDKSFTGYFIGYSDEGEVGYRLYIPDLQEVIVGVNITFNEVIPSYEEEYFNELNKLSFEVAPDESTVDTFQHLVGESYSDDDTLLEFVTTRVVEYKGLIVAYRAPVLGNGRTGREEKSPIHVADVMRMRESSLRLGDKSRSTAAVDFGGERARDRMAVDFSEAPRARSGESMADDSTEATAIRRTGVERMAEKSEAMASSYVVPFGEPKRTKFDLRESKRDLSEGEEVVDRLKMNRNRLKMNRNLPSRVETEQIAPSARTDTDRSISENLLHLPQQTQEATADVSRQRASSRQGDTEIFVSHKWGHYEPVVDKPVEPEILSGKRIRQQRNISNRLNALGKAYAATEGDDDNDDDDDDPMRGADPGGEAAPEMFGDAVKDPRWRESMQDEIRALRNRGVWRVISTPGECVSSSRSLSTV